MKVFDVRVGNPFKKDKCSSPWLNSEMYAKGDEHMMGLPCCDYKKVKTSLQVHSGIPMAVIECPLHFHWCFWSVIDAVTP